jgi:hypothetical protein
MWSRYFRRRCCAASALQQVGEVPRFAVDAALHGQAEKVRRAVDAPAQRVDIGTQRAAQVAHQRGFRVQRRDAAQQGLGRAQAARLDGGFVAVGGLEVGQLARVRARGRGGSFGHQCGNTLTG